MKLIRKDKTKIGYRRLLELKRKKDAGDINISFESIKNNVADNDYIRNEVMTSLLEEQGYICAYCMQQIDLSNATIEHIIGQKYIEDGIEIGKNNEINYDNFFAVCQGNTCKNHSHCDKNRSKYQKNRPLFANPLDNRTMQNIKFSETGAIYYKKFIEIEEISKLKTHTTLDEDSNIRYDLQEILNLNCQNLKERRALIVKSIKRLSDNGKQKEKLRKILSKYESKHDNKYDEFCEVAIKYITKILSL